MLISFLFSQSLFVIGLVHGTMLLIHNVISKIAIQWPVLLWILRARVQLVINNAQQWDQPTTDETTYEEIESSRRGLHWVVTTPSGSVDIFWSADEDLQMMRSQLTDVVNDVVALKRR